MPKYLVNGETLTSIADTIRAKTGKTGPISLTDFTSEITNIKTGTDTSDADATASSILNGKTAYVKGEKITGTIKSVAAATPTISVNSSGKITATVQHTTGYVVGGAKSATQQLTTQAAKTVTPSSSSQTAVNSGVYTTGAVTVAAIPNDYAQMNFSVVGGTSTPSSTSENTIWVNTDTEITSWVFSPDAPTSPSDGIVWFYADASSATISFNALKENNIHIRPKSAKQYVNGAWVNKTAKIYQNGAWKDWARYIFRSGEGPIVPITHYQWNKAKSSHTDDYIQHTRYNSGNDMSATCTTSVVDLTGYSTIYALANYESGYDTSGSTVKCQCIGLSSAKPNFTDVTLTFTRPNIALTNFSINAADTVYSLQIPSGLAAAYIWIQGNGNVKVYDIWME